MRRSTMLYFEGENAGGEEDLFLASKVSIGAI